MSLMFGKERAITPYFLKEYVLSSIGYKFDSFGMDGEDTIKQKLIHANLFKFAGILWVWITIVNKFVVKMIRVQRPSNLSGDVPETSKNIKSTVNCKSLRNIVLS